MAVVSELITRFRFQGTIKPLKEHNSKLGEAIKSLKSYTGAIKSALGAFRSLASYSLKLGAEQTALADSLGISSKKLQELSYAAEMTGAGAGDLESSLSGLGDHIGKAAREGSVEFARLGISVRDTKGQVKSADAILEELGDTFKALNISGAEKADIANSLGIKPSLLNMLESSSSEIRRLRNEASVFGITTEKQTKIMEKYSNAMTQVKYLVKGVSMEFGAALAPIVTRVIGKFKAFAMANKDLIKNGLALIAAAVGVVVNVIMRAVEVVFGFIDALGGLKSIIVILGALLLMSPMGQLIAIITLVILIIDDLIVAFQGGESVIRSFFLKIFGYDIASFLQGWVALAKESLGYIAKVLSGILDIVVGIVSLDMGLILRGLKKVFDGMIKMILHTPVTIVKILGKIRRAIIDYLVSSGIKEKIEEIIVSIITFLMEIPASIRKLKNKIINFFNDIASSVKDSISKAMAIVLDFKDRFIAALLSIPGRVKTGLTILKDNILNVFKRIFETIKSLLAGYINFYKRMFNFKGVGSSLTSSIKSALDKIKGVFVRLKNNIMGVFTLNPDRMMDGAKGFYDKFVNIIEAIKERFASLISSISGIIDTVKSIFESLKNIIVGVFTLDTDLIAKGAKQFVDLMFGAIDSIKEYFKGVIASIGEFFEGPIEAFKGAWETALEFIKNMFKEVFDKIAGIVSAPIDKVKGLVTAPAKAVSAGIGKVKGFFGFGDNEEGINDLLLAGANSSTAAAALQYPDPSAGWNSGGSNITNSNAVTQNIEMNVSSSDPVLTGEIVADRLTRQLEDAENANRVRNI